MKKTSRYLSVALVAASMLTLLAACGEQSAQEEETKELISEIYDSNGFEGVDSSRDSVTENGDDNNDNNNDVDGAESKESGTDTDDGDNDTEAGGSSGSTVDLPKLPI